MKYWLDKGWDFRAACLLLYCQENIAWHLTEKQ